MMEFNRYEKETKDLWGHTSAYKESKEKEAKRTPEENQAVYKGMMDQFVKFNELKSQDIESDEVQNQVKTLQDYISNYFYHCTNDILAGLGKMYADGGEFTKNIDAYAGSGTALFTSRAIEYYCRN
ncbi:TipAS antibiotic-recognition domain-containing protein [Dolosicoccus paucivorans]